MEGKKIRSYTDLNAWKEAHRFVVMIYGVTESFPKSEMFRLVDQLCRAVVSITSNIAEGFSRNSSKEKIHFYAVGLGSLTEVQNQLNIAKDLEYISKEEFQKTNSQAIVVNKLIHGLMKSAKDR